LNTGIINVINNDDDKCYIKLVLNENLKNAMYIPHRDVSKTQFFLHKKIIPWYKRIHLLCLISMRYCKYIRLQALPIAAQVKEKKKKKVSLTARSVISVPPPPKKKGKGM
jgi:hypothetical protein